MKWKFHCIWLICIRSWRRQFQQEITELKVAATFKSASDNKRTKPYRMHGNLYGFSCKNVFSASKLTPTTSYRCFPRNVESKVGRKCCAEQLLDIISQKFNLSTAFDLRYGRENQFYWLKNWAFIVCVSHQSWKLALHLASEKRQNLLHFWLPVDFLHCTT